MPYKSDKQERLMRAVAHSPDFAKKVGISQSVGRKFEEHKAEGGSMRAAALKKIFAGKETPAEERKEKTAAKKAGMSYKTAERKFEGEKYCGGGKTKRYADGGETEVEIIGPQTTSDEGTFKEAFATARKRGEGTFTWKGKKYSTAMAGGKTASADGYARSVRSGIGAGAGRGFVRPTEPNIGAGAGRGFVRPTESPPEAGAGRGNVKPEYKTGGSVRGVGIAKRGYGCTGMK